MCLHKAKLLGCPIVKHASTGCATITNEPKILAQIVIDIGLASALRTEFYGVKTGFYGNQEAGKEFMLAHDGIFLGFSNEAVRIVLHRCNENIHPFLHRELLARFQEVVVVNRIGAKRPEGCHIDISFLPALRLKIFQRNVTPVFTVNEIIDVAFDNGRKDVRITLEVNVSNIEGGLAGLQVTLYYEAAGKIHFLSA